MRRRPLFSTYSQGENRVTGSMIAVFERLDLSTLTRLLEIVTEESTIELVTFDVVKPEGPGRVPDARIRARFKFLFEVKTEYGAVNEDQLRGHLDHLKDREGDERLFVISPDAESPATVEAIDDPRMTWFSFAGLGQAIDVLLDDSRDIVAGDERFLLRELQALFEQEGLLGREDTVVVAARRAHGFYLRHSAYVCQQGRSFRPVARLGFYKTKNVEPQVPSVLHRRDNVSFDAETAAELRLNGDDTDLAVAELIERCLAEGSLVDGVVLQVFLLSSPDDDRTITLPAPVAHTASSAWTMGQRYTFAHDLERAQTTADLSGASGT